MKKESTMKKNAFFLLKATLPKWEGGKYARCSRPSYRYIFYSVLLKLNKPETVKETLRPG